MAKETIINFNLENHLIVIKLPYKYITQSMVDLLKDALSNVEKNLFTIIVIPSEAELLFDKVAEKELCRMKNNLDRVIERIEHKKKEAEYHVHVYPVEGKVELAIKANSEMEAREKALQIMKKSEDFYLGEYPISDCRYIAIIPKFNEENVLIN